MVEPKHGTALQPAIEALKCALVSFKNQLFPYRGFHGSLLRICEGQADGRCAKDLLCMVLNASVFCGSLAELSSETQIRCKAIRCGFLEIGWHGL